MRFSTKIFFGVLIFITFIAGNRALYYFSQLSVYPTPESLLQRFQHPNFDFRFRAFSEYGYARQDFTKEESQKLDAFLLNSLKPDSEHFEADEVARLIIYKNIWVHSVVTQASKENNKFDFSLIIKDKSPKCRKFGIDLIFRNFGVQEFLKQVPYFFSEKDEIVIEEYLAKFAQVKVKLSLEIQKKIISDIKASEYLQKKTAELLSRLVRNEQNLLALKLLFSYLEGTNTKLISQAKKSLATIEIQKLDWVPKDVRLYYLTRSNSTLYPYTILLIRPDLYEQREQLIDRLRTLFSIARSGPIELQTNLFYILLYHKIWDESLIEMAEKLCEQANISEFQLYYLMIRLQQNPSPQLLKQAISLVKRLASTQVSKELFKFLTVKDELFILLCIYNLNLPGYQEIHSIDPKFFPKKIPSAHVSILLDEVLRKIKRRAERTSFALEIFKMIAADLTEEQIDSIILKLENNIWDNQLLSLLDVLEKAPQTENVQNFLIAQLNSTWNVRIIKKLCETLTEYYKTEAAFLRSKYALSQIAKKQKRGRGKMGFLKTYLKKLEENYKNHQEKK